LRRALALVVTVACAAPAAAATAPVGVDEHLGARVPLDAVVRDSDGAERRLRELVDPSVPTLLVLAYFRCPLLCDQVVGGLASTVPAARVASGVDYRVLVVSFDPRDAAADAAAKTRELLASLSAFEKARWHLVVDDRGSAAAIAASVGFRYRYDAPSGQYAHPAVALVLTPDGRVSRYLYGVSFPSDVIAAALRDAAGGRAVPTLEHVLLTCFQYVPALRRHAAAVAWILRGGTLLLFALLAATLVLLVRRQRHRLGAPHHA